jgi:hypothetical protein
MVEDRKFIAIQKSLIASPLEQNVNDDEGNGLVLSLTKSTDDEMF